MFWWWSAKSKIQNGWCEWHVLAKLFTPCLPRPPVLVQLLASPWDCLFQNSVAMGVSGMVEGAIVLMASMVYSSSDQWGRWERFSSRASLGRHGGLTGGMTPHDLPSQKNNNNNPVNHSVEFLKTHRFMVLLSQGFFPYCILFISSARGRGARVSPILHKTNIVPSYIGKKESYMPSHKF